MLSSIISAMILAALHDAMNRSLNGHVVNSDGPWSQQWTSRYATALAFLMRMSFVICACTAFVQRLWLNLSTHQQTLRIKNLDILSGALSDPLSLVSGLIWLRNPLLLMIAIISWTLPYAAIITPGTLSVASKPDLYTTNRTAIRIAENKELADWDYYGHIKSSNSSIGVSEASFSTVNEQLYALASKVVASSQVVPMKSNFANQTFLANLTGPALKCTENTDRLMHIKFANYHKTYDIVYLAWTGDEKLPGLDHAEMAGQNISYNLRTYDFLGFDHEVFRSKTQDEVQRHNSLWIFTQTGCSHEPIYGTTKIIGVECQLWNATYEIEFTSTNYEQSTIIHGLVYTNPILIITTSDHDKFLKTTALNYFPKAILSIFAPLVVGVSTTHSARMAAGRFRLPGITNMDSVTDLSRAVEQTFANLTLSLLSMPELLANTTDTISTTVTDWSSKYVYQQEDLLLAYGLSLLASSICCMLGMHAFYKNGTSFQNNFSTFIRAAGGSDLDLREFIPTGDTGADPLPKRLAETMITMASRRKGNSREV